jgi:hypothetical protein
MQVEVYGKEKREVTLQEFNGFDGSDKEVQFLIDSISLSIIDKIMK